MIFFYIKFLFLLVFALISLSFLSLSLISLSFFSLSLSSLPVSGVAAGGLTELIQNDKTGYLVSNSDGYYEFSQRVQALLSNVELRTEMGRQARYFSFLSCFLSFYLLLPLFPFFLSHLITDFFILIINYRIWAELLGWEAATSKLRNTQYQLAIDLCNLAKNSEAVGRDTHLSDVESFLMNRAGLP